MIFQLFIAFSQRFLECGSVSLKCNSKFKDQSYAVMTVVAKCKYLDPFQLPTIGNATDYNRRMTLFVNLLILTQLKTLILVLDIYDHSGKARNNSSVQYTVCHNT